MNSVQHIAIIMDGNGRWAKLKNRPRAYGHIKGARVAKKIVSHASDLGIKHITLYTFSTENWSRSEEEVGFLMQLLDRYVTKEADNFLKKNIRFDVLGDLTKIPENIKKNILMAMEKTQHCTGLQAHFAISYGGRDEITMAVKNIAKDVVAGRLSPEDITSETVCRSLMTKQMPDPDLVIRTSGEYRLSNFLLWQSAYSEFIFSKTLWPKFDEKEFDQCLEEFSKRHRRFGQVESS